MLSELRARLRRRNSQSRRGSAGRKRWIPNGFEPLEQRLVLDASGFAVPVDCEPELVAEFDDDHFSDHDHDHDHDDDGHDHGADPHDHDADRAAAHCHDERAWYRGYAADLLFAPNTPPEVVEELHDHDHVVYYAEETIGPSYFVFGDSARWRRTAIDGFNASQGESTTITWSIVPDGTTTINDRNGSPSNQSSNLIARLDAIYGSAGVSVLENKVWFAHFQSVFDRWSEVSGVDFVYEPNDDGADQAYFNDGLNGVRGDIRIAGHTMDGNSGVLAYNYYPDTGDMVIDTSDNFYNFTAGNSIRLRNVLAHEVGHGLGIGHVQPVNRTKLMEPYVTTSFDGPQFDDILAAHRGYGDSLEENGGNDEIARATDLGVLTLNQTIRLGDSADTYPVSVTANDFLSIDDNSDVDVFRFEASDPTAVQITARPLGPTYESGSSSEDNPQFNASAQSDLTLTLLNSSGTVLNAANFTGPGLAETMVVSALPGVDYFIRVDGAQNAAQFYGLEVTSIGDPPPPPAIQFVDNGEPGFQTVGSWIGWGGQGRDGDVHEAFPGDGSAVASWTFFSIEPGEYNVAATWSTYSNRATNATYAIVDGTTTLATATVNQQITANDFTDEGSPWEMLASGLIVEGNRLVVELNNLANGRLNADAIRIERVGDGTPGPEIQVVDGTTSLEDGAGQVDFGTTPPGVPISRTITVRNAGTADLTLVEPIQVPSGFTITSSFGSTTLAPSDQTSFTVRLDASSVGAYSGTLSFDNNDDDEDPFTISLLGVVAAAPPPPVVEFLDNGQTGFSTVGSWAAWGGQGRDGDVHEAFPGTGSRVATWQFTGLQSGEYTVAATWTSYSNRATNSPFRIYNGSTLLETVRVNQQQSPGEFQDDGSNWNQLADGLLITGDTLVVTLADDANGRLNADAIRIERTGSGTPSPEIQVTQDGTQIADGSGSVAFGTTAPGSPVSRTFTVHNLGSADLTLQPTITVPNGFTVTSGFGTTTLASGSTTQFTVRLDAASEGDFSGPLSFANDDADENPYNFDLSGSVGTAPPEPVVRIIDNGDAGFSQQGNWSRWVGQGRDSDIHESLAGNGQNVAAWTFEDLPTGNYQVSATWSSYSNRATNSPFALYDGSVERAVVRVNQRTAPVGFAEDGSTWQNLGTPVAVQGGTLIVRLSNDADGRLNADAVRIERVS